MQAPKTPVPNSTRTATTKAALIAAARQLFCANGYAGTGTPEIVEAANLTRGALYHHFADKEALFAAVIDQELAQIGHEIEKATATVTSAFDALLIGGEAFIRAMADPGRQRMLLLDAPAVLGRKRIDELDANHGPRTLKQGILAAIRAGDLPELDADALTSLMNAAYDRAASDVALAPAAKQRKIAASRLEEIRRLWNGLRNVASP